MRENTTTHVRNHLTKPLTGLEFCRVVGVAHDGGNFSSIPRAAMKGLEKHLHKPGAATVSRYARMFWNAPAYTLTCIPHPARQRTIHPEQNRTVR
jgi:hypothetical protein